MKYLPEILFVLGLLVLVIGIGLACGLAWALIAAGLALIGLGVILDRDSKDGTDVR